MKARLQKLKAEIQLEVAAEITIVCQRVIERRFSDILDVLVGRDDPQPADPQPAETLLPELDVTVMSKHAAETITYPLLVLPPLPLSSVQSYLRDLNFLPQFSTTLTLTLTPNPNP
jgi:hypothetical protein